MLPVQNSKFKVKLKMKMCKDKVRNSGLKYLQLLTLVLCVKCAECNVGNTQVPSTVATTSTSLSMDNYSPRYITLNQNLLQDQNPNQHQNHNQIPTMNKQIQNQNSAQNPNLSQNLNKNLNTEQKDPNFDPINHSLEYGSHDSSSVEGATEMQFWPIDQIEKSLRETETNAPLNNHITSPSISAGATTGPIPIPVPVPVPVQAVNSISRAGVVPISNSIPNQQDITKKYDHVHGYPPPLYEVSDPRGPPLQSAADRILVRHSVRKRIRVPVYTTVFSNHKVIPDRPRRGRGPPRGPRRPRGRPGIKQRRRRRRGGRRRPPPYGQHQHHNDHHGPHGQASANLPGYAPAFVSYGPVYGPPPGIQMKPIAHAHAPNHLAAAPAYGQPTVSYVPVVHPSGSPPILTAHPTYTTPLQQPYYGQAQPHGSSYHQQTANAYPQPYPTYATPGNNYRTPALTISVEAPSNQYPSATVTPPTHGNGHAHAHPHAPKPTYSPANHHNFISTPSYGAPYSSSPAFPHVAPYEPHRPSHAPAPTHPHASSYHPMQTSYVSQHKYGMPNPNPTYNPPHLHSQSSTPVYSNQAQYPAQSHHANVQAPTYQTPMHFGHPMHNFGPPMSSYGQPPPIMDSHHKDRWAPPTGYHSYPPAAGQNYNTYANYNNNHNNNYNNDHNNNYAYSNNNNGYNQNSIQNSYSNVVTPKYKENSGKSNKNQNSDSNTGYNKNNDFNQNSYGNNNNNYHDNDLHGFDSNSLDHHSTELSTEPPPPKYPPPQPPRYRKNRRPYSNSNYGYDSDKNVGTGSASGTGTRTGSETNSNSESFWDDHHEPTFNNEFDSREKWNKRNRGNTEWGMGYDQHRKKDGPIETNGISSTSFKSSDPNSYDYTFGKTKLKIQQSQSQAFEDIEGASQKQNANQNQNKNQYGNQGRRQKISSKVRHGRPEPNYDTNYNSPGMSKDEKATDWNSYSNSYNRPPSSRGYKTRKTKYSTLPDPHALDNYLANPDPRHNKYPKLTYDDTLIRRILPENEGPKFLSAEDKHETFKTGSEFKKMLTDHDKMRI